MTPRHLFMAATLSVAAWLALFGDKTPEGDIAEPVAAADRSQTAQSRAVAPAAKVQEATVFALRPRAALPAASTERSAALFAGRSWAPPPPPAAAIKPAAPPFPFIYVGKKLEDNVWEVYLARGDQTYIAAERAVIDGVYRIDAIRPPILTVTYLPMNQIHTLPIGAQD